MKLLIFGFLIFSGLVGGLFSGSPAFALKAGPMILSGKVTSSNEKTATLDLGGEQEAELPMKFIPAGRLKNGRLENGTKLAIALSEEQTKQVKIHKK